MNKLLKTFLVTASMLTVVPSVAQAEETLYTYNKGQVIDFLFLTRRPNSDDALQQYFKAVIPTATELGYKPQKSFAVAGKPTQGNIYPDFIAVGAWPGDFEDRHDFHVRLRELVPGTHSRRMDIWSALYMTNYELREDISFTLDSDKHYVLTAYWQEDAAKFKAFTSSFLKETEKAGGTVTLSLTDGRSPLGYAYDPDLMVISEWEDEAAFDAFLEVNKAMDHDGVRHVNQFPVRAPKPRG